MPSLGRRSLYGGIEGGMAGIGFGRGGEKDNKGEQHVGGREMHRGRLEICQVDQR